MTGVQLCSSSFDLSGCYVIAAIEVFGILYVLLEVRYARSIS